MALCGYCRKHVIGLLNERRGPRFLGAAGLSRFIHPKPLRLVLLAWFGSDQLCGKRLQPALPEWLPNYEKEYGALALTLSGEGTGQNCEARSLLRRLPFVKTRLATIGRVAMDDPALSSFVYR